MISCVGIIVVGNYFFSNSMNGIGGLGVGGLLGSSSIGSWGLFLGLGVGVL